MISRVFSVKTWTDILRYTALYASRRVNIQQVSSVITEPILRYRVWLYQMKRFQRFW
jgi:hypothetical protein